MLEQKDSEKLWRGISTDIRAAASAYPIENASRVDANALNNERARIEKALHGQGFVGKYPSFFSRGKLRGAHLRDVKGTPQFVGFGKTMDSYIECVERYDGDGRIAVDYAIGAIFPHGEAATDAYSGFFADENRRFGSAFGPALPKWNGKEFTSPGNEEVALLAAKTARLEKLTKREQEKTLGGGNDASSFGFSLALALVGGIAFGVVMTAGMGLVSLLVGGIAVLLSGRDASALHGLLEGLPWLKLLVWSGGGFALTILAVMMLSQVRKPDR